MVELLTRDLSQLEAVEEEEVAMEAKTPSLGKGKWLEAEGIQSLLCMIEELVKQQWLLWKILNLPMFKDNREISPLHHETCKECPNCSKYVKWLA